MSDLRTEVHAVALAARKVAGIMATASRADKDRALEQMASAILDRKAEILAANELDVDAAVTRDVDPAIIDRLTLTESRIQDLAEGLRSVAKLADPVGETVREFTGPSGIRIRQRRVPFGVVAMIYEARPNVTVDAAGLCLKSGNCALLRGSSSAQNTNQKLVDVMRTAIEASGLPIDAIQLVPGESHEAVQHLLTARKLVDVVIPRGGAALIERVVTESTVPVIETGVGNCHVYVDESADLDMALSIVMNSKTQRVSVCNAAETLLVHKGIARSFLPLLMTAFKEAGVTVHGDASVQKGADESGVTFIPATDVDWSDEYYSMDIAARVVESLDDAIAHISQWSTGHTEAIVATDPAAIERFTSELDSAVVMVNTSTRFTDGMEFGFGAEIGISTQKLHARGPMGLQEMTTTSYVVTGDGQIRS